MVEYDTSIIVSGSNMSKRFSKKIAKKHFKALTVIAIIGVIGVMTIALSGASTPTASVEPESGVKANNIKTLHSDNASGAGDNVIQFGDQVDSEWSWPATVFNTGPAPGTVFTSLAPREFGVADSGKVFDGVQIDIGNGQEDIFKITGSNITFKNCKIVFTGNVENNKWFFFVGNPGAGIRPKNILFDHCIIDSKGYHEYGIHARNAQFSIQYSQIRGASHLINSNGDLDGGTINIYRNYMYDWHDKPYATGNNYREGHANVIYFIGNNGNVNIEDNTIIGNRYEMCTSGWSQGPGPGCLELNGTGAITVYANESEYGATNKNYIIKHNQISGSSYMPLRFYGDASHKIESIKITNNVYTTQSGWPKSSIEGNLYSFNNIGSTPLISGNSWGSDTVCFASPASCPGNPNLPN